MIKNAWICQDPQWWRSRLRLFWGDGCGPAASSPVQPPRCRRSPPAAEPAPQLWHGWPGRPPPLRESLRRRGGRAVAGAAAARRPRGPSPRCRRALPRRRRR
ncbi:hypothetical protein PVAP13_9KG102160 [Panicum virgatum]|uniref:Uncharacterized protein n=1 Tax=Panicum virgatum TaxID=38727 RepID=A0A8T0NF53_PANVG|nr:hypothetical protein PVAP13_9KG102160 [Panicum virgatum]